MSRIEKQITVHFRHQIHFTENVFDNQNPLLRDVLVNGENRPPRKAILIVDEGLSRAMPSLVGNIQLYFASHPRDLLLVCPPILLEGGEKCKNAYFHVSEIQSQIDRHHIDRHSYLICVGGGALL
ncbi:MAG: 3-dehydroquinate synthase, partial [Planctomycetia bacterium]